MAGFGCSPRARCIGCLLQEGRSFSRTLLANRAAGKGKQKIRLVNLDVRSINELQGLR